MEINGTVTQIKFVYNVEEKKIFVCGGFQFQSGINKEQGYTIKKKKRGRIKNLEVYYMP